MKNYIILLVSLIMALACNGLKKKIDVDPPGNFNDSKESATEPKPTDNFSIYLTCKVSNQVTVHRFSFLYGDIKKKDSYVETMKLITQQLPQYCDQKTSKIFRINDAIVVKKGGLRTTTSGGNLAVIVMPDKVIAALGGDSQLAFAIILSYIRDHHIK